MRATLYSYERDTLEAIDRDGELQHFEISDRSGWPAGSCASGMTRMRKVGLVYKAARHWRLTDAGKIVLAITRGKEMRARLKRKAAGHGKAGEAGQALLSAGRLRALVPGMQ